MQHGDITHLEIPADDIQRAQRFYEGTFRWSFQSLEGFDDYTLFTTPVGHEGTGGAIGKRGVSAADEVRHYVQVDSIDETLRKVGELGGSTVTERSEVPGQGWYAVARDTEGNELGLWEQLPR